MPMNLMISLFKHFATAFLKRIEDDPELVDRLITLGLKKLEDALLNTPAKA